MKVEICDQSKALQSNGMVGQKLHLLHICYVKAQLKSSGRRVWILLIRQSKKKRKVLTFSDWLSRKWWKCGSSLTGCKERDLSGKVFLWTQNSRAETQKKPKRFNQWKHVRLNLNVLIGQILITIYFESDSGEKANGSWEAELRVFKNWEPGSNQRPAGQLEPLPVWVPFRPEPEEICIIR